MYILLGTISEIGLVELNASKGHVLVLEELAVNWRTNREHTINKYLGSGTCSAADKQADET